MSERQRETLKKDVKYMIKMKEMDDAILKQRKEGVCVCVCVMAILEKKKKEGMRERERKRDR